MKRILSALTALACIFSAGCEKPYGEPAVSRVKVFTLLGSNWNTPDNSLSYTTSLGDTDIDNEALSNKGVLVYLSFDNGVTYEQIPELVQQLSYTYKYSYNNVTITLRNYLSTTTAVNQPPNVMVKVVVTP